MSSSPGWTGKVPLDPWGGSNSSDESGGPSLTVLSCLDTLNSTRTPTCLQTQDRQPGGCTEGGCHPHPGAAATVVLTPSCRALPPQESEGISCHYWSLFDGHAGSGAAVVASRLLQHHVTEQLQDIVEILKNSAVLPPTCLGEEPDHTPANSRTLTRAASLRGGVGAPGSPGTPPTRFFTEKKIPHECLVIGALESAFKEMVGIQKMTGWSRKPHPCFSEGSLEGGVSDMSTCCPVALRVGPPPAGLPLSKEVSSKSSSMDHVLAEM